MRRLPLRVPRWGLALILLASLAGCGGSPDTDATAAPPEPGNAVEATQTATAAEESAAAPPAGPVDACALVTQEDAEELARTKLDPGRAGDPSAPSCTYTGPVSGPTAQVEVYAGDGAKKMLDIDRDLGHEFTPVSGAGDEAYAEENTVFVRKGTVWVAIRLVLLNDPAENREPLEKLARKAAERL